MEDLISRQAAITIPVMPKEHRHYQTNNLDDAYDQGWFDLQNCIEQLPSAQPERRGRWVKDRLTALNGGSYEVFRCSECQSAFNWRMAYCGHCGAKMEVEP